MLLYLFSPHILPCVQAHTNLLPGFPPNSFCNFLGSSCLTPIKNCYFLVYHLLKVLINQPCKRWVTLKGGIFYITLFIIFLCMSGQMLKEMTVLNYHKLNVWTETSDLSHSQSLKIWFRAINYFSFWLKMHNHVESKYGNTGSGPISDAMGNLWFVNLLINGYHINQISVKHTINRTCRKFFFST